MTRRHLLVRKALIDLANTYGKMEDEDYEPRKFTDMAPRDQEGITQLAVGICNLWDVLAGKVTR